MNSQIYLSLRVLVHFLSQFSISEYENPYKQNDINETKRTRDKKLVKLSKVKLNKI